MAVELDGQVDGKGGPHNDADSEVAQVDDAVAEAEASLEALADRMSDVISASPDAERESLHDYAVSLVRDALPVAADRSFDSASPASDEHRKIAEGGTGAQALGYGALLIPVGFFLIWIFPLIGAALFIAGGLMVVWGMIASLLGKAKRQETDTSDDD